MKRTLKWIIIVVGGLLVLTVAALLIIPSFVDIQRYKAEIENRVSEIAGVPVTIGGNLHLKLIPWVGLAVSDVQIGNPEGFQEKQMLSIKSFEVRVKLLPLISKDVQVDRFILNAPRIVLERGKDGRGNWEAIGKKTGAVSSQTPKEEAKRPESKNGDGLPIKSLAIGELTLKDGTLLWIDQTKGERREVSALILRLKDVSMDRPIDLALSARLDGQPVSLEGKVGPVGKDPGKGTIPLELALKALKELDLTINGQITDPAKNLSYELNLAIAPFSPRKLTAALGQQFPLQTAKSDVIEQVALAAQVKGDTKSIAVSNGSLNFDESKLMFSFNAGNIEKPEVTFDLHLNQIELDSYLPPPSENKIQIKKKSGAGGSEKEKVDYTLLRKLTLNGKILIGGLKAQGLQMQEINLRVTGKDGLFQVDPLGLKLDQSRMALKGTVDVRQDIPSFDLTMQVDPFSPRKIMATMGKPFPVKTADPNVLTHVALQGKLKGTQQSLAITDASLELDKTKMNFWVKAKDLNKPDMTFDLSFDQIDLDAYLPASNESKTEAKKKPEAGGTKNEKFDYAPVRKLILDGKIRGGRLQAQGLQLQDLDLRVAGKDGLFQVDPLALKLEQSRIALKGAVDVRQDIPGFDLSLQVDPLSPRKILATMGKTFPVKTADPQALSRVAFQGKLKGNQQSLAITDGSLELDKTKMNFWFKAKDLNKPDVAFDLSLDRIDLDAYLPPPSESQTQTEKKPEASGTDSKKPDYAPLRKLVLDGKLRALALMVHGAEIQNLNLAVSGKDGIFRLDPLMLKAYQGNVAGKGSLDVRENIAKSSLTLETKGVQIGPLLREQLKKDFLEGALESKVSIAMTGDDADQIKRSLNGNGELVFSDGAIKGIDIPGMVRNLEAKFGLVKQGGERPRTDFSELKSQFTITNGLFDTPNTTMMSPVLRAVAAGKADLVKETLDFMIDPKFVGTLKGQGDTMERSGVMVPVLVAGTFSSPTFRPDLAKLIKQDFTEVIPEAEKMIERLKEQQAQGKEAIKKKLGKDIFGQQKAPPEPAPEKPSQKDKPKTPEEKAKELLKGLPFGK